VKRRLCRSKNHLALKETKRHWLSEHEHEHEHEHEQEQEHEQEHEHEHEHEHEQEQEHEQEHEQRLVYLELLPSGGSLVERFQLQVAVLHDGGCATVDLDCDDPIFGDLGIFFGVIDCLDSVEPKFDAWTLSANAVVIPFT